MADGDPDEYKYDYRVNKEKTVQTYYDDTGVIEVKENTTIRYDEDGDLIIYESKTGGTDEYRHENAYRNFEVLVR